MSRIDPRSLINTKSKKRKESLASLSKLTNRDNTLSRSDYDLFKPSSQNNKTSSHNNINAKIKNNSKKLPKFVSSSSEALNDRRSLSEKTIQSICIGKMKEKFTKCDCSKMPLCNTSLCLCRKNGVKCNFRCHRNSMCIWKH